MKTSMFMDEEGGMAKASCGNVQKKIGCLKIASETIFRLKMPSLIPRLSPAGIPLQQTFCLEITLPVFFLIH